MLHPDTSTSKIDGSAETSAIQFMNKDLHWIPSVVSVWWISNFIDVVCSEFGDLPIYWPRSLCLAYLFNLTDIISNLIIVKIIGNYCWFTLCMMIPLRAMDIIRTYQAYWCAIIVLYSMKISSMKSKYYYYRRYRRLITL